MKATSVKIYLGSNTVKIIRKVFKHDVLTKAIELERKSLDNILFWIIREVVEYEAIIN